MNDPTITPTIPPMTAPAVRPPRQGAGKQVAFLAALAFFLAAVFMGLGFHYRAGCHEEGFNDQRFQICDQHRGVPFAHDGRPGPGHDVIGSSPRWSFVALDVLFWLGIAGIVYLFARRNRRFAWIMLAAGVAAAVIRFLLLMQG